MIAQLAAAVAILTGPIGLTNDNTPTFTFSGATECSVDAYDVWSACSDALTTSELADGAHVFRVRNGAGETTFRTFTVDTVAPDVAIDGAGDGGSDATTATVAFSSTEPGTEFTCAIGSGEAKPCTSPYTTPDLADGEYSVVVRGSDGAGNVGTATRLVHIQASKPETTLDGPEGSLKIRTPTYGISSSRAGSHFQCKVDEGAWAACDASYTPTLAPGHHTIQARAIDAAGNVDPTPAGREVDVQDCQTKVDIGAVEAIAECFVKDGDRLVSDNGSVKVNGITINAYRGGQLAIEPAAKRLWFDKAQLRIGGIVLYVGEIRWTVPAGDRITLANLDLSSHTNIDETPKDSESALDLEGDDDATVQGMPLTGSAKLELAKGGQSILTGNVELPRVLTDAEGHGLTGSVSLTADNATGLHLSAISVKAPLAFIGKVEIHNFYATYNGAHNNDAKPTCNLHSPGLKWEGGAESVVLPTPDHLTITQVGLSFADQGFNSAHGVLTANDPGVSIGGGIRVQKIEISVCAGPPAKVEGRIALTALPGAKGPGLKIPNAGVIWQDGAKPGDPWTLRVEAPQATLNVGKELTFKDVHVGYSSAGAVDFGGRVNFSLGLKGPVPGGSIDAAVAVDAGVAGWITGDRFNANFDAKGCFAGKLTIADTIPVSFSDICPNVKGVVSTAGMAVCGGVTIKGKDLGNVGVGYTWGGDLKPFAGACDLRPWTVQQPSAASAGTKAVYLRGGARGVLLAVRGGSRAPQVSVHGPHGVVVDTPADSNDTLKSARALAWENTASRTTYVLLAHPARGRWTVHGDVLSVDSAEMRPPAKVSARLRGGELRYRVAPVKGQRVSFLEQGRGVSRTIATATRGGAARFRPAAGPGGARRIVALVEQDGLPRTRVTVARFKAHGPARPKMPAGLAIATAGGVRAAKASAAGSGTAGTASPGGTAVTASPGGTAGTASPGGDARARVAAASAPALTITWRPAKDAARYGVRVALADGRRLFFLRDAGDREVRIAGARGPVSVRVVGLRADNTAGPAAVMTSGGNR